MRKTMSPRHRIRRYEDIWDHSPDRMPMPSVRGLVCLSAEQKDHLRRLTDRPECRQSPDELSVLDEILLIAEFH